MRKYLKFKVDLNCNSEKVLYLPRCKICDDTPYAGKAKTKFCLRFNNYKSKHESFRKGKENVPQKRFIRTIFKIAIEVFMIGK